MVKHQTHDYSQNGTANQTAYMGAHTDSIAKAHDDTDLERKVRVPANHLFNVSSTKIMSLTIQAELSRHLKFVELRLLTVSAETDFSYCAEMPFA